MASTISVDSELTPETARKKNYRWFCDDTLKNDELIRMVSLGWKIGLAANQGNDKNAIGLYQPIEQLQLGSL